MILLYRLYGMERQKVSWKNIAILTICTDSLYSPLTLRKPQISFQKAFFFTICHTVYPIRQQLLVCILFSRVSVLQKWFPTNKMAFQRNIRVKYKCFDIFVTSDQMSSAQFSSLLYDILGWIISLCSFKIYLKIFHIHYTVQRIQVSTEFFWNKLMLIFRKDALNWLKWQ